MTIHHDEHAIDAIREAAHTAMRQTSDKCQTLENAIQAVTDPDIRTLALAGLQARRGREMSKHHRKACMSIGRLLF